jgi:hypothetical protein
VMHHAMPPTDPRVAEARDMILRAFEMGSAAISDRTSRVIEVIR